MADQTHQVYYGTNRAAKAIYGAILLFVFIAGLKHQTGSTPTELAGSTFIAAITIVVAEIYSEIIGERIKSKGVLNRPKRRAIINDAFAIAGVSIWPSIIMLGSATGLYTTGTAITVALAYLLAILLGFSYWANRETGLSRLRSLIWGLATLGVGVGVIWLKYAFGH